MFVKRLLRMDKEEINTCQTVVFLLPKLREQYFRVGYKLLTDEFAF